MAENYVDSIPCGKNDPPMLSWDPSKTLLYDFNDPDSQFVMFNRELYFRGFVMTDWTSYDSADVAEMAIAGNAWIIPGSSDDTFTRQIEDAVSDGRLPLARLQDNVRRLLGALVRLNRSRQ